MKKSISFAILLLVLLSFSLFTYADLGEPNFTEVPDFHEHNLDRDISTSKVYNSHVLQAPRVDSLTGVTYWIDEVHQDYSVITYYDVHCTGCDYAYSYSTTGSKVCPLE